VDFAYSSTADLGFPLFTAMKTAGLPAYFRLRSFRVETDARQLPQVSSKK
jgi:hypothetical protein